MISSKILSSENPTSLEISRISTMALRIAHIKNFNMQNICGIIMQFVGFIYDYSIIDTFSHIFLDEKRYKNVQDTLVKMQFIPFVFNEISLIDLSNENKENQYYSKNSLKAANLFTLANYLTNVSSFHSKYLNPSIIDNMFKNIGKYPSIVEDERWKAIVSFNSPKQFLKPYYSQIINYTNEPLERLTQSQTLALSLCTTILNQDSNFAFLLVEINFCQILLRYITQFPNNSTVQKQVYDFVYNGICNKIIRDDIINTFIEPLMTFAVEDEVSALKTNSREIIIRITEVVIKDKKVFAEVNKITGYTEFIRKVINPYITFLRQNYGMPD